MMFETLLGRDEGEMGEIEEIGEIGRWAEWGIDQF